MLVLSRRPGEEIIINGNIRVTVVSVKGDRVRIGIAAPDSVPVDRAEVHKRRVDFAEVGAELVYADAVHHDDDRVVLGAPNRKLTADDTQIH